MPEEEIDELDHTLSEVDASLETDSEENTTTSSLHDNKTELHSDDHGSSVETALTDVPPAPRPILPAPTRMTRKQLAEAENAAKHTPVREETQAEPSSLSNDDNQDLRIFHPGDGVTPILLKSSHHSGGVVAQSVQAVPAGDVLPSDNMRMTRNAARLANISVAEPPTPAPTIPKRKSRILQQRSAKYKTFDLGGPKDETEETSNAAKKTAIPKPSKVTTTAPNKRQGRSATKLTTVSEESEDTPTPVVMEATEKAVDDQAPALRYKGRKARAPKKAPALDVFQDANSAFTSTTAGVEANQLTASMKPSTARSKAAVHVDKNDNAQNDKGTSTAKKPSGRGLKERKANESDNMNTNTAAERRTRSHLRITPPSPSPVANESLQNPQPSNPFRITRRRKAQVVNTSTEF